MEDQNKKSFMFRNLFVTHFIQIITGIALYFYSVGFLCNVFFNISFYGNLLFSPSFYDNTSIGVTAFFVFLIIFCFGVFFYELLGFVFTKSSKKLCMRNLLLILIYIFGFFIINKLIIVAISKLIFVIGFFFLFIFSFVSFKYGILKLKNNRTFISFCVILIALFVLLFPVFLYGVLLPSIEVDDLKKTNASVLTTKPLGLANEQLSAEGYLNNLSLVKHEDKKSIFIDPLSRQIIILKDEYIIRIKMPLCDDPFIKRYRK